MIKISVLMSVFNESEKEIKESVESILYQSFKEYEFIIVNDNPLRHDLADILDWYRQHDNRIKIITNSGNIGLAMSLNKAAKLAIAPYLARMDADDISEVSRLKKQYNTIHNRGFDLVCSRYSFINEKSECIKRHSKYYTPEQIKKKLPLGNIAIHHPTVIMRKEAFIKAGGYRNYLSAQDYDLWLRLLYNGCLFYMIDEKLLKYRIRGNSVSLGRRSQQQYTISYIRDLYKMRLKSGKDNYSYASYLEYLSQKNCFNEKSNKKTNEYFDMLIDSKFCYDQKKYLKWLFLRLRVFINCGAWRSNFIGKIKMKLFLWLKTIKK